MIILVNNRRIITKLFPLLLGGEVGQGDEVINAIIRLTQR